MMKELCSRSLRDSADRPLVGGRTRWRIPYTEYPESSRLLGLSARFVSWQSLEPKTNSRGSNYFRLRLFFHGGGRRTDGLRATIQSTPASDLKEFVGHLQGLRSSDRKAMEGYWITWFHATNSSETGTPKEFDVAVPNWQSWPLTESWCSCDSVISAYRDDWPLR